MGQWETLNNKTKEQNIIPRICMHRTQTSHTINQSVNRLIDQLTLFHGHSHISSYSNTISPQLQDKNWKCMVWEQLSYAINQSEADLYIPILTSVDTVVSYRL